jgi:hypothetical protein
VSCAGGAAPGRCAQVYQLLWGYIIEAVSSVYANIHSGSVEAFVRVDLLHSYMHTRFICLNHFASLIIVHQLFLVDVF